MRIAIDVTASVYEGSGVGTYYRNLVPQLLNLGKDHEFILFGYSLRRFRDLTLANRKFLLPPQLVEVFWNRLHRFPIERLIGRCDLVHTWDYIQPPAERAKIVTTIHDLTPLKFPEHHLPRTISAYKAGLRWVKKEAAHIIADSLATKEDLIGLLGVEQKRVSVVHLASPQMFHEFYTRQANLKTTAIDRVKRAYGIEGSYILSVGTMEPRKNIRRIIEAHETLQLEETLVIIGRFGWGEKLYGRPRVKMVGFVPDEDLPSLYAGASLFVYPSLYEGFGLPVLEAMAVGCPVVTSNRGSLKEVAGEAAVEVNPESVEAIAFGIKVALERAAELRVKGLAQAAKFSWQETARKTLEVYETIGTEKRKKA